MKGVGSQRHKKEKQKKEMYNNLTFRRVPVTIAAEQN